MTQFHEHKRPDEDTLTTQLHRTPLFSSSHPLLTQIVKRNQAITDVYALGTETQPSASASTIYPNTVYPSTPPRTAKPSAHFKPFTRHSFNQIKAPYHNDIITAYGYGPPGQRTYHVVIDNEIRVYSNDNHRLAPAD